MDHVQIIERLSANAEIFKNYFRNKSREEYLWKPESNNWCLLEVVCHLHDEEREDFRARVKCTLDTPGQQPPPIDPVGWVTGRKYIEQNYERMVGIFLDERKNSISWLKSLKNPAWENAYVHSKLGSLSAKHFLVNWLAHDIFHFRQIIRLQYQYIKHISGNDLTYAGNW